ncbi:hypothetical protein [Vibrio parahaemolyticus]|uniref:hypothetical protein n=1 Tax=Vibrio parahaemolyticus TaxID=670 RepID=UPI00248BF479|nr:hypothetical protein [Vibrio parahaemolyticus]
MELLNNEWVVGIGGGILSGLIVTLITRYLFSRKDNKEYAQKVASVNREVVYALRPGISEGHIPEVAVLDSLINATARKYRVESPDVYQPKQIAEELIKEIMDSSFISSETKQKYCSSLSHLVISDTSSNAKDLERLEIVSDLRRKQTEWMSLILGVITGILTAATAFEKSGGSSALKPFVDTVFPTLAVLATVLVATVSMFFSIKLKKENKKKSSEKSET